jgi:hypothetical protein
MPYIPYKLLHFFGIFIMITALAVTCAHALRGGTRKDNPHRKAIGITHGVAALLILIGGFGMLARMGVAHGGLPGWVLVKLGIWVAFAAAMAIPYLGSGYARLVLVALPILGVVAGATALYKPF